jgi:hypothetical protein
MTATTIKKVIKQALVEGLDENREAVRDLIAEVLEDLAMTSAIREGEKSKPVKRSAVMKALAASRK